MCGKSNAAILSQKYINIQSLKEKWKGEKERAMDVHKNIWISKKRFDSSVKSDFYLSIYLFSLYTRKYASLWYIKVYKIITLIYKNSTLQILKQKEWYNKL